MHRDRTGTCTEISASDVGHSPDNLSIVRSTGGTRSRRDVGVSEDRAKMKLEAATKLNSKLDERPRRLKSPRRIHEHPSTAHPRRATDISPYCLEELTANRESSEDPENGW